jgi:hypothetical protein
MAVRASHLHVERRRMASAAAPHRAQTLPQRLLGHACHRVIAPQRLRLRRLGGKQHIKFCHTLPAQSTANAHCKWSLYNLMHRPNQAAVPRIELCCHLTQHSAGPRHAASGPNAQSTTAYSWWRSLVRTSQWPTHAPSQFVARGRRHVQRAR